MSFFAVNPKRSQLEALVMAAESGEVGTTIAALVRDLGNLRGTEVVFAFLGTWRGRSLQTLPLLSRIALVHAAKRVALLGFAPMFKLVEDCTGAS